MSIAESIKNTDISDNYQTDICCLQLQVKTVYYYLDVVLIFCITVLII